MSTSSDWYARKLSGQPAAPRQAPLAPPVTLQRPPVSPYPAPGRPDFFAGAERGIQQQQELSGHVLPDSAKIKNSCPSCGSGNYMQVGSQVTQNGTVPLFQCYDCGYPKVQAGTNTSGQTSQGPTMKAKQVAAGGWNPSVVDRSFI